MEKERGGGKKERECLSCDSALSKQRYLHLIRTYTSENGLPCGAHHSRRQAALFTTVYLSDTISGSDVCKKLGSSPRGGGRSKARVTFMRDLPRKTRYFPASAAANKGGHISSPLFSLRCNANFGFSRGKMTQKPARKRERRVKNDESLDNGNATMKISHVPRSLPLSSYIPFDSKILES